MFNTVKHVTIAAFAVLASANCAHDADERWRGPAPGRSLQPYAALPNYLAARTPPPAPDDPVPAQPSSLSPPPSKRTRR